MMVTALEARKHVSLGDRLPSAPTTPKLRAMHDDLDVSWLEAIRNNSTAMHISRITFKMRIASKPGSTSTRQSRATLCSKLMLVKHVFVSLSMKSVYKAGKSKTSIRKPNKHYCNSLNIYNTSSRLY